MAVKQSRCFLGVLYPDSESYVCDDVLLRMMDCFTEWAFILHDKDICSDTGELKKAHVHWVARYDNPSILSAVANKLGIAEHDIEYCKSWRRSLRYLIHADSKDKFQYDVTDVSANFDYSEYLKDVVADFRGKQIYDFIVSHPHCSYSALLEYVFSHGLYSEFRRGVTVWNSLLTSLN